MKQVVEQLNTVKLVGAATTVACGFLHFLFFGGGGVAPGEINYLEDETVEMLSGEWHGFSMTNLPCVIPDSNVFHCQVIPDSNVFH